MTPERLSLLAHELRSPVAALAALAERARAGTLPAAARAQALRLALAAGRDVERLLADPELLSIQRERIDLDELLAGMARPGVTLTVEAAAVECDATRVRQAIANLVANGLRHGTAVTVAARREDDRVVVEVRDDGPGVDGLADPFARGASGAGSTGYGLWLARAIAEAHGGELTLQPAPGPGATFRLSLPRASAGRG